MFNLFVVIAFYLLAGLQLYRHNYYVAFYDLVIVVIFMYLYVRKRLDRKEK